MSFALTTDQVRQQTKTVTRRIGWAWLRPGTLLQPVVKAQGLKKGQAVERIGGPIRVVDVRRERIDRLETEPAYGYVEVRLEGYPLGLIGPFEFSAWFQKAHPYQEDFMVTRIEFEYVTAVPRA
jgi:hypothetical protein